MRFSRQRRRSFKAEEFGESHVQLRVMKQRMGQVGLFGDWLERHKFGTFVRWEVGAERRSWQ